MTVAMGLRSGGEALERLNGCLPLMPLTWHVREGTRKISFHLEPLSGAMLVGGEGISSMNKSYPNNPTACNIYPNIDPLNGSNGGNMYADMGSGLQNGLLPRMR